MRAYLVYHKPAPKVAAHRIAGTQYSAKTNGSSVLPEKMDVVVKRLNGKTTSIGSINLRTGEFRMNRNFDLKGRHVGENKKARGAYYGKKILRD